MSFWGSGLGTAAPRFLRMNTRSIYWLHLSTLTLVAAEPAGMRDEICYMQTWSWVRPKRGQPAANLEQAASGLRRRRLNNSEAAFAAVAGIIIAAEVAEVAVEGLP